jgi:hypothetical protein
MLESIRTTMKTVNRKGRIYRLERVTLLNRTLYAVHKYNEGTWEPVLETGLYEKALEAIV